MIKNTGLDSADAFCNFDVCLESFIHCATFCCMVITFLHRVLLRFEFIALVCVALFISFYLYLHKNLIFLEHSRNFYLFCQSCCLFYSHNNALQLSGISGPALVKE